MLEQVQETLGSFRVIAAELRPAVLDEHGLIAAIQALARDSERLNGLPCRVRANRETVRLDIGRSTLLFFIVKEALANVMQHAQATLVTIDLKISAKRLVLSIADNGQGISERDLKAAKSLGLTGMQERAALLGGTLEIAKRRPSGTLVKINVPLPDTRQ
jgi:signal transduction histidine kinase